VFGLTSCGIYSFTGAAVSPDTKTISVDYILNESGQGPPRLAQTFTEKLRDYYQSNSSLKLVKQDGDLQVTGNIVGYEISPIAPTANELASSNRLTIRVDINFINTKDTTQNIKKQFSFYDDYNANQSLSTVENDKIEVISTQIVFDIFNSTLANW